MYGAKGARAPRSFREVAAIARPAVTAPVLHVRRVIEGVRTLDLKRFVVVSQRLALLVLLVSALLLRQRHTLITTLFATLPLRLLLLCDLEVAHVLVVLLQRVPIVRK